MEQSDARAKTRAIGSGKLSLRIYPRSQLRVLLGVLGLAFPWFWLCKVARLGFVLRRFLGAEGTGGVEGRGVHFAEQGFLAWGFFVS